MRLQRHLAQGGVASRRKAEELIVAGKVRVNGKVVTELGTQIDPEKDRVEVEGQAVAAEEKVYLVLNKPKGYVTTVDDPEGRKTVMELLPADLPARVVPVGRLDYYTEGVLLFTNDGDLQAGLLHPRRHVEKTYHAKIRGHVSDDKVEKLREGVMVDGRRTKPAKVHRLKDTGTHDWLVITIAEGRTRQIHKMAESLRLQVTKLARVAFAGVTFEGLRMGDCRYLEPLEVQDLYVQAGLGKVKVAPPPRLGAARVPYVGARAQVKAAEAEAEAARKRPAQAERRERSERARAERIAERSGESRRPPARPEWPSDPPKRKGRPVSAGGRPERMIEAPRGPRPPWKASGRPERTGGGRPERTGGERKPFGARPERTGGGRPERTGGERKPFGARPERTGGERKSFGGARPERKASGARPERKPPAGGRPARGERPARPTRRR
jgi:23S rRNA pseudouridine2605 synthase